MKIIEEVFREIDCEDEHSARQARDERASELQAQGFLCIRENLYTIAGHRVFLLRAMEPKEIAPFSIPTPNSLRSRIKSSDRPVPAYETR